MIDKDAVWLITECSTLPGADFDTWESVTREADVPEFRDA